MWEAFVAAGAWFLKFIAGPVVDFFTKWQEAIKATHDRRKAKVDADEAEAQKAKRERIEKAWQSVKRTISERRSTMSDNAPVGMDITRDWLNDLVPDEDDDVKEEVWAKLETLPGMHYNSERKVYILRKRINL